MTQRWWRPVKGVPGGPPAEFEARARADLAASAPDEPGPASEGWLAAPAQPEHVRDYLRGTPHDYVMDAITRGGVYRPCACGLEAGDLAHDRDHHGGTLLRTRDYLAGLTQELVPLAAAVKAGDGPPVPVTSDSAGLARPPGRDALDDIDEAVAGITDADVEDSLGETLRRAGYDAPAEAAAGAGRRTADALAAQEALELYGCDTRAEDDAPPAVPLPEVPRPGQLPDGVLGYGVAIRPSVANTMGGRGYLASADLMDRATAEHVVEAWPGGGRAVVVEIREVTG